MRKQFSLEHLFLIVAVMSSIIAIIDGTKPAWISWLCGFVLVTLGPILANELFQMYRHRDKKDID